MLLQSWLGRGEEQNEVVQRRAVNDVPNDHEVDVQVLWIQIALVQQVRVEEYDLQHRQDWLEKYKLHGAALAGLQEPGDKNVI